MRKSDLQEMARGNVIVKCGCGLPMRHRNWGDHWRTCHVGSEVECTEQDRQALLASEGRTFLRDQEHREWQRQRDEQIRSGRTDVWGRAIA